MRYLMLLILRSKIDWSTTPTGVDPAILLPSTLWNERLGVENGGTGDGEGIEMVGGRTEVHVWLDWVCLKYLSMPWSSVRMWAVMSATVCR